MIILDGSPIGSSHRHLIALFGSGLIGSAVRSEVNLRMQTNECEVAFNWTDTERQKEQSQKILSTLEKIARENSGSASQAHLDVVWCAGSGGFGSSYEAFELEQNSFQHVIDMSKQLRDRLPDHMLSFHLISSAGGLFEGQMLVGNASRPKPLRPYGHAKLRQEQLVQQLPDGISRQIYRPTSVYGHKTGGRVGLISALASALLLGRTAKIVGRPGTIRDYIFNDDIARFVTDKIIHQGQHGVHLLGSGKPTSVFEAIRTVEAVFQRPIYVQYDTKPSNAMNQSVEIASLPGDLRRTDFVTGVKQTIAAITTHYYRRVR